MPGTVHIKKVSIIGAGSWGTSIAIVIAEKYPGIEVNMWAYEKSVVSSVNTLHENLEFLPGVKLPSNLTASSSMKESVAGAGVIIFATPSKVIPDISAKLAKVLQPAATVGFLTKGFCRVNGKIFTISQTIESIIPILKNKTVAISGPSHAEEVSNRYHTCLNVASVSAPDRALVAGMLTCEYLACRETDDIIGVEVGGTLKNPAAIAAGVISALPGCGDNLSGALISEAMKEMLKLGRVFGARDETLIDISGLGDLVATALSGHSRNRRFGIDVANQILKKGSALSFVDRFIMRFNPDYILGKMSRNLHYLAEGAYAIEPLLEFASENNITIPVYRSLYEVLLNKKNPSLLIETIKNPGRFDEVYGKTKIILKERKRGLEKVGSTVFIPDITEKTIEAVNDYVSKGRGGSLYQEIFSDSAILSLREKRLVDELTNPPQPEAVRKLVSIYIRSITDHYSPLFNRIYRLLTLFSEYIKGITGRNTPEISYVEIISNIKPTETIIYIPVDCGEIDIAFMITTLKSHGYPFPRFILRRKGAWRPFSTWFLRKAGAFVVNPEKMNNMVYRETVMQYISVLLGHGIPVLYSPGEAGEGIEDKMTRQFLERVIDIMFSHTVEVKIIPIRIDEKNSIISDPITLSDYTSRSADSAEIASSIIERMSGRSMDKLL